MKKKNPLLWVPADKSYEDWREEALLCGPFVDEEEAQSRTVSAYENWDWDEADKNPEAWEPMTCAEYAERLWDAAVRMDMAGRRYQVSFATMDADQIAGTKPYDPAMTDLDDYVRAGSPEEAIDKAMAGLADQITGRLRLVTDDAGDIIGESFLIAKVEGDSVIVYNDDVAVEEYYNFTARLVGGDD